MAKPPQFIPQRPTGPTPRSTRNMTPEERERAKQEQDPNSGDPEAQEAARAAAEYAAANPGAYSAEHVSVLEDADVLADRLEQSEKFLEANRNLLLGAIGAIIALVVGGFLFYQWRGGQDEDAQARMFPAVNYFEADSLKQALNGDGQNPGLLTIADEYGSTKAGNLANFYAGVALLKQGKFQDAADHLEKFSSDDLFLQARAYCLQGDAQMELGNKDKAAELYLKAANYKANPFFSAQYLMKAAGAQEAAGSYAEAVKTYDRILTEYPNAPENNDAKRYKARAEAMASGK